MEPLSTEWISRDEIRAAIAAQLDCPAADVADDDDLIQLGLNSIRMMSMAGRWRKRGADITFAQLAATATVQSWHELLNADQLGCAVTAPADRPELLLEPEAPQAPFPLATMQHAYWIGRADEQELGGVAAHLYVEFDGTGIDPERLERAVSDLVAVHPMLRTRFLADGTQQTMPSPGRPVFALVDLRGRVRTRLSPHCCRCVSVTGTSAWQLKTVRSSTSRSRCGMATAVAFIWTSTCWPVTR